MQLEYFHMEFCCPRPRTFYHEPQTLFYSTKNVLVGLLKILRECHTNVLNTILQFELNLDAFLDEPINLDAQNTNNSFFQKKDHLFFLRLHRTTQTLTNTRTLTPMNAQTQILPI